MIINFKEIDDDIDRWRPMGEFQGVRPIVCLLHCGGTSFGWSNISFTGSLGHYRYSHPGEYYLLVIFLNTFVLRTTSLHVVNKKIGYICGFGGGVASYPIRVTTTEMSPL